MEDNLPEYLGPDLRVVFVGINPSLYSVQKGHYFARPQNRFWPALSLSRLSARMRQALDVEALSPEHDSRFLDFGFGLTDLVRRPTAQAGHLKPEEFRRAAPDLRARLQPLSARVICFQGMTGYRPFLKHGLGLDDRGLALGLQPHRFANACLWVVPNPSPANATYSLADLVARFDELHAHLQQACGS
jgi:TDG/mug DNA glycosylase family protein